MTTSRTMYRVPAASLLLAFLIAPAIAAQDVAAPVVTRAAASFHACYDPAVGAIYLIKLPGLAEQCLKPSHLEIVLRGASGEDPGPASAPSGPAGGDLGGTYPNPLLVGLQGKPVSSKVPLSGQVLFFQNQQWRPVTPAFGGDVTGGVNTMTVVKLRNQAIAATAPAAGQVLQWDAIGLAWTPQTLPTGVTAHSQLTGLTADDHPQYLLANGNRSVKDGFAVTGTVDDGMIPAKGSGTRLMWYPAKAAFRAGYAVGREWDDASVGQYSTAIGSNTTASGSYSTAMGTGTMASGSSSTAMGVVTTASGLNSTAMGTYTTASGNYSTATGYGTTASGNYSTAMGYVTTASGSISTAIGSNTTASASISTAMGANTTASGYVSTAMGAFTTASGSYSTAMGWQASTNGMTGSFVYGDNSTSSPVLASAANEFTVRAAGGIRLRTAANLSTGCSLLASGSTWQCPSSKTLKTDFADVDGDSLLARLHELPVQTWRYKAEDDSIRHMGPYAEDFRAAFALGTDSVTIGHIDLGGVSLAAAKALEARTRDLSEADRTLWAVLAASAQENAALRAQLAEMARRLERLEKSGS